MTEYGHHAAWRGDIMHSEVNMINSNAASDEGKSDRVSGCYANGTRTSTVCLSAFDMGDERSCAAKLAQSVRMSAARRRASCSLCADLEDAIQ